MQCNIPFRDTLTIGLMLFALFFGAGNLVFPVMLGQHAGNQYWLANLGFLGTGVGLPLLGTLAFGFSGSKNLLALTSRVHPWFAYGYTTLLYLTIGPLFAMPRTGSVSYEIGIKPFIDSGQHVIGMAVFTVAFFGVTLIFSLNPSRMIDLVGKILTPALIACIALLAIAAIANPIGHPQAPVAGYATDAFFVGFQEGYLTMDALAAFVFGIIVIDAIQAKGIGDHRNLLTAVPVLTILYPLAIVLILLTFFHHWFHGNRTVYAFSLLFTFLVSFVEGLDDTPLSLTPLHDWFSRILPLYAIGLGWLIPALVGVLIGLLVPNRQLV